jgi:uncharacterized membrane protein (DUF373 family)
MGSLACGLTVLESFRGNRIDQILISVTCAVKAAGPGLVGSGSCRKLSVMAPDRPTDRADPDGAMPRRTRAWIARGYTIVEDVVYIGLGLLLAGTLMALLVRSFISFVTSTWSWTGTTSAIDLLDQVLLILLIVELLYTVQVSFRSHAVAAEPFLLVGLISAIRRVLVLTAEMGQHKASVPPLYVVELAVLAVMVVAMAISFMLLRRKAVTPDGRTRERSTLEA